MRLYALRGAITVEANDADEILQATDELMRELLERNELAIDDVVSAIFTMTPDLDAEFPALAARRLGFDRTPLLCAREIAKPGALERVIRVLMHYQAPDGHRQRHVYLREATVLRTDLDAAQ